MRGYDCGVLVHLITKISWVDTREEEFETLSSNYIEYAHNVARVGGFMWDPEECSIVPPP